MATQTLPQQMLACQLTEFKKPYKIQHTAVPQARGPYDLVVKVAVASLCHTDGMVADGIMGTKLPCTASHEGAGTVAAVGSAVKDYAPGDRVMCGLFRNFCGECEDCKGPENYTQYCGHNDGAIGVHTDGAFAEYVLCDARTSAKLPGTVSFETAAPLACAGCTVWRGVLQSECKEGEYMGLVGSGGGLGHLGIQFAKALGIKVIGIDARDEGLELTKSTGADVTIDARKGNDAVAEQVMKLTDGKGCKSTVNVSDARSAAATACAITRKHGVMVQIAQPETVDIPFAELVFRDIRVHGSLICSPDEARRMLDVVAEHGISVKTNAFNGLNEIPKLIEFAHGGKMQGKGICLVDPEQIKEEEASGVEMA